MTDRELLELAAKAAGLEGLDWRNGSGCFYYDDPETGREEWNPLARDGQALRLAVKLRIDLDFDDLNPIIETYRKEIDGDSLMHCEAMTADPFAATRRAIVRAAATLAPLPSEGERLMDDSLG